MPTSTDILEIKIIKSAKIQVVPNDITPKQSFELKIGSNTFGRKHITSVCHFQISTLDSDMSRSHILLESSRDKFSSLVTTIKDLNSSNGTFLNNRPIARNIIYLTQGDKIRIGNTELLYIPSYLEVK